MKKFPFALIGVILTLIVLFLPFLCFGATIFEDNFNSYTDGDLNAQGGWVKTTGLISVQGTEVKEGAKAVYNSAGGDYYKVGTLMSDGKITVYMRATGQGEAISYIYFILKEGGVSRIIVGTDTTGNGRFGYANSAPTWVDIGTYPAYTYFSVEIEWRSSDHTFRVSINGGTWTGWLDSYIDWVNGLDTVEFGGTGTAGGYFDYIAENPFEEEEEAPSIFTIPNTTDITGYINDLFSGSGLYPLVALIIGLPLAFWVISEIANLGRKKLGWFTGGGFEKDPFLTKEDKKYYRREKERKETKKIKKSDWL